MNRPVFLHDDINVLFHHSLCLFVSGILLCSVLGWITVLSVHGVCAHFVGGSVLHIVVVRWYN
jgi:hypothetical protein